MARLMAEMGIAGICGRKKVKTTRRDPSHELATDLVERDFSAQRPDQLGLTDVTYIATDQGWLSLCSILDVFSRRLLGWSLAYHLRTELCLDALGAAAMVRGRTRFVGTVLLRSIELSQYTSDDFKKRCRAMDIVQSMGSVGDSYDNSMMESAWSSLKRELVYETHFATREEARRAVFEWLIWYNGERLHSSIDYMSPIEFEESWDNQVAARRLSGLAGEAHVDGPHLRHHNRMRNSDVMLVTGLPPFAGPGVQSIGTTGRPLRLPSETILGATSNHSTQECVIF